MDSCLQFLVAVDDNIVKHWEILLEQNKIKLNYRQRHFTETLQSKDFYLPMLISYNCVEWCFVLKIRAKQAMMFNSKVIKNNENYVFKN